METIGDTTLDPTSCGSSCDYVEFVAMHDISVRIQGAASDQVRAGSNAPHRPLMIHRALFGSVERFFGVLVEHYAGAFPVWLAPVQVIVLTITDRLIPYAERVARALRAAGLRVELNARGDKIGAKIRD